MTLINQTGIPGTTKFNTDTDQPQPVYRLRLVCRFRETRQPSIIAISPMYQYLLDFDLGARFLELLLDGFSFILANTFLDS